MCRTHTARPRLVRSDGPGASRVTYRGGMSAPTLRTLARVHPTQPRPPRRRWWQRWALVESNLRDGSQTVLSWHMTRDAAKVAAADLICTYEGNALLGDWFTWEPAHHSSALVAAVMSAPDILDRFTAR